MTAYAIYTRQSRVRHDITLSSCDVQFQICRDFAEAVLPQGSAWCGTRYDDPGQSGENLERPALKALLSEIGKGAVSHLIVYRLDRLSRRLADTVQILEAVKRHAVSLKIVTAPMLGESATSQFMLNMLASFAEFERGLISERIKESFRARRLGGERLTGKPPFGYDLPEHGKALIINRGEARKVGMFFRMATAGQTPRQIAAVANGRGWKTKVHVALSSGRRSGGNPWTARQVLDLLHNPVYVGCLRDENRGRRPGRHQAIVKKALFNEVQACLKNRRRAAPGQRLSLDLPFKGKVSCAKCGRLMSPHVILNRHKPHIRYIHYRCRSQAGGRSPCQGVSVPAGELHRFVGEMMRDEAKLNADLRLTPEFRQSLLTVGRLLDGLRVPDPYRALGELVESIAFSPDQIEVRFDASVLQRLIDKNHCSEPA